MATLITEPANTNPATIDWQAFIAKTTKVMGECAKFRLTNMTADTEPQVAAGSRFEVNGSYYECASAENITGWSSMGLTRYVYVYGTPSGGSVTFSYSETAPTFDSAKGGWFNSTARALFKIYKTTATGWTAKRYVDIVEGVSGNWTNILSRDVGTDWSTAMLNSAGPGMLAELIKIGLLTGLNADLLDGYHAGNGTGQIPVNNGLKNINLWAQDSDLHDGYHAGNAASQIPVSNGTVNTNLNADSIDGYHAGNDYNRIPISDNTRQDYLFADRARYSDAAIYALDAYSLYYHYTVGETIGSPFASFNCLGCLIESPYTVSYKLVALDTTFIVPDGYVYYVLRKGM